MHVAAISNLEHTLLCTHPICHHAMLAGLVVPPRVARRRRPLLGLWCHGGLKLSDEERIILYEDAPKG